MRSVNLVPLAHLRLLAQRRRTRSWVAIGAAGALVLALAASYTLVVQALLSRSRASLSELALMSADLDRRCLSVSAERDETAEAAARLLGLYREHTLPDDLLNIFASLPAGVSLGRVEVYQPQVRGRADPNNPPPPQPLRLRVDGHATSHDGVSMLIRALERIPRWSDVTLVGAAEQPLKDATVIAFQVDCGHTEDAQ